MEITRNQILYIENDLKAKGLNNGQIREELIDHVCCLVEEQLHNGLTFTEAYGNVLNHFMKEEFKSLNKEYKKQRMMHIKRKLMAPAIAASIMLCVFVVDAQDKPDLHPLGGSPRVSSEFGMRIHPITKKETFHRGIDLVTPIGTPVKVSADGYVKSIKETEGYGKYIVIQHDETYATLYATLSEFKVTEGDRVFKGQVIALSGNSGMSTAPHLHYEIIKNGDYEDPLAYMD